MKTFKLLFLFFVLFLQIPCALSSSASASAAASSNNAEHSPRFLVHLLDYLAKDYAGAVSNGKIINQNEFDEQVEFIDAAIEANKALPETKNFPQIISALYDLRKLITTKQDADLVAKNARSIQAEVIKVTGLEVAPTKWPNLSRGKQLFNQNCVSCHGTTGRGDGALALNLNPKPANFYDPEHMNTMSAFHAFNSIRIGIPGTAMAPFNSLTDKEVWDLGFYVLSLRYEGTPNSDSKQIPSLPLEKMTTLSDEDIKDKESIAALRLHSEDEGTQDFINFAISHIEEALSDYKAGQVASAKKKALAAYLEGVEPIEPRLKASDSTAVINLETSMANVRTAIESLQPYEKVALTVQVAKENLNSAATLLEAAPANAWLTFLMSSGIILREGFEAVLIIIALLGVIRAAGSRKAALWVHGGWILALGSGFIAWIFSGWLMGISGGQRELMEALTSVLAVIVLLYIGFWLHNKTEIKRWNQFIHGRIKTALEGSNLLGLAAISFMAVFREAFETVLFLRAIWLEGAEATKSALAAGVGVSLLLIFIFAYVLLKFSAQLPIRKLFTFSSVIMIILAIILTGKGLHAFQETGLLSITSAPFNIRWDLFGIYPTLETLLSQVAIVGLSIVLWTYGRKAAH